MNFFTKLFKKQPMREMPSMPSWETVVEMMYDKHLDAFSDEVVKVIYSKDRWMRYVVLKDEKEFFTYQLEAIYQYDEDEWKYICSHDNVLPAMWEPFRGIVGKSVFENIDELLNELKAEPEYKQYFWRLLKILCKPPKWYRIKISFWRLRLCQSTKTARR